MDYYPFDDDYVRRLRDGDRVTEEHYSSYFPPKLQIVLRILGTRAEDVDDVIQDALMRVLVKVRANEIRDGHTFGKYVVTTCRNIAKEEFRKSKKTEPLPDGKDWPDPDNPLNNAISRQQKALIRAVLAEMEERDATILRELYLDELEKDEICERHKVDRKYLRVLLHRARQKFRSRFLQ